MGLMLTVVLKESAFDGRDLNHSCLVPPIRPWLTQRHAHEQRGIIKLVIQTGLADIKVTTTTTYILARYCKICLATLQTYMNTFGENGTINSIVALGNRIASILDHLIASKPSNLSMTLRDRPTEQ